MKSSPLSDSTAVAAPGNLAAGGHAVATPWRIRLRGGATYLYLLPSLVFLAMRAAMVKTFAANGAAWGML